MKQQILTQFPLLSLSSLALLIFFAFFVALLILVNLKPQQEIFKKTSGLPLEDGDLIQETHHA